MDVLNYVWMLWDLYVLVHDEMSKLISVQDVFETSCRPTDLEIGYLHPKLEYFRYHLRLESDVIGLADLSLRAVVASDSPTSFFVCLHY